MSDVMMKRNVTTNTKRRIFTTKKYSQKNQLRVNPAADVRDVDWIIREWEISSFGGK
jgi:hypothetical protein